MKTTKTTILKNNVRANVGAGRPKAVFARPYNEFCTEFLPVCGKNTNFALKTKGDDMNYSVSRRRESFLLPIGLVERLQRLAKRENRSLDNYVETVLTDVAYHEPNDATLAAMKEVKSGALRNATPLDLSSVEAMEKSMGL